MWHKSNNMCWIFRDVERLMYDITQKCVTKSIKQTCVTQKRDSLMQIENQEGVTVQCSWTKLKYFLVKHHACRSCVCRSVPTWLFDVTACPAMCISNRALDSGFLLHSDCNSFSASLSCRELVVVFNFSCQMRKKSNKIKLSRNWSIKSASRDDSQYE